LHVSPASQCGRDGFHVHGFTHAISSADILNFNRWDALQRAISFLFFEPKLSFGRNIPQLTYTASMLPIAYDRSIGIAFQLPKNFELRATQHQV